jgi:hypothetical protein
LSTFSEVFLCYIDIWFLTTSENQEKGDLSEKTIGNLDNTVSGTKIKNQQNYVVSARKNVTLVHHQM